MKRNVLKVFALLLGLLLLLPGCGISNPLGGAQDIDLRNHVPQLNFGTLEYEKLSKLPWNSGRTESTGYYHFAETEQGYYFFNISHNLLYYADKANLSNWVVVCNKPNCKHKSNAIDCNGRVHGNSFLLQDNRIIYSDSLSINRHLYPGEADGKALFSKAFDGTDLRLEYVMEEGLIQGGGAISDYLSPDHWIYNVSQMQKDGTYVVKSYRRTKEDLELLFEEKEEILNCFVNLGGTAGERTFYNTALGDYLTVYRVKDEQIVPLDLGKYKDVGGYLSGDILRFFRPNDGYYDVNLTTGEEVFICNAQLKNSRAAIRLPNCIIETTFISKTHPEGAPHAMAFFDGKRWHNVSLPEELPAALGNLRGLQYVVTSDSILVFLSRTVTEVNHGIEKAYVDTYVFQLRLGEKNPTLECVADIKESR